MPTPKRAALAAALAALSGVLAGCGGGETRGAAIVPYADDGVLTAMTWNVYLGAHLAAALDAATPEEAVRATTAIWGRVVANDPAARAEAIAAEIAIALPDVVGLQEATLWRAQTPGDAAFGGTIPATAAAADLLASLIDALARRGLAYEPVRVLELLDVEGPIATGADLRLTDRIALLVRSGVPVANARGAPFSDAALARVAVAGRALAVPQGWIAADVSVGGRWIAVYDTHLESLDARARDAQAVELAALVGAAAGPAVVLGDLNAVPGAAARAALAGAGLDDAWELANPADPAPTCCWPEDLSLSSPAPEVRVDAVLARGLSVRSASRVGEQPSDRTASGLWPSDHAGVVAALEP